jgi:hypothetical protein
MQQNSAWTLSVGIAHVLSQVEVSLPTCTNEHPLLEKAVKQCAGSMCASSMDHNILAAFTLIKLFANMFKFSTNNIFSHNTKNL